MTIHTPRELRTIRFEDNGQDFLEWDIDRAGKVVACRPFQASVWCGCAVLRHRALRPGTAPQIVSPRYAGILTLRHRIRSVTSHAQRGQRHTNHMELTK